MIEAPRPPDEQDRLAALKQYTILDTPPDQAFDDLASLAAHLFDTPIALISLVDETRQWFKASVGVETKETPRSMAFCAHAILGHEVMVVPDTKADQRFADNPLVLSAPHIRFYAGAPLETADGYRLGTLCVIDRRPRSFTRQEQDLLALVSRQAAKLLELHRSNEAFAQVTCELEFFQQVVDQTQDPIYWLSPAEGFRFVYVNNAACRHFGYSADELLHMRTPDWSPDLTEDLCLQNWVQIKRDKRLVLETRHRRRNGEIVPVEVTANYVGFNGSEYIAGTIRDISQRKQAEQVLLEKERMLEAAEALAHLGSWSWNVQTHQEAWSDEQFRIFGLAPRSVEVTYETFVRALHPDDKDRVLAAVDAMLRHDRPYDIQCRIRRPDGEVRMVHCRGTLHRDPSGAPIRMDGTVLDVTEQKRAERERNMLLYAIDHGMEGMALLNAAGRYTYMNPSHAQMHGFEPEELIGRTWRELYGLEVVRYLEDEVFPALHRQGQWIGELVAQKKTGEEFDVEVALRLLDTVGNQSETLVCVCRDITQRRRAEEAIRKGHEELERRVLERTQDLAMANARSKVLAENLLNVQEAERRMIAQDLHDEIGQSLTALKINLQQAQRRSDEAIRHGCLTDSVDLVDQLLAHVRSLALDLRPSLLDDLGLVPALRWLATKQAERAGWSLDLDLPEMRADLSQAVKITCFRVTQEALTNVARHAKAAHLHLSLRETSQTLRLLIQDDGVGFDAIQAQAETHRGMSLGLLGMAERVGLVGGTLRIDSRPLRSGAAIDVMIPLELGHDGGVA